MPLYQVYNSFGTILQQRRASIKPINVGIIKRLTIAINGAPAPQNIDRNSLFMSSLICPQSYY